METDNVALGIILGIGWGIAYAAFLQLTAMGRYMVERVTWLTVVIGIGVDLLIAGPLLGWPVVLAVGAVVGASSIGIIARSLYNYQQDHLRFERMLDRKSEDAE